jgi:hypothetical protein
MPDLRERGSYFQKKPHVGGDGAAGRVASCVA